MAAQRPSLFKQHFEQALAEKRQQQQLDAARKPQRVNGLRQATPVAEPAESANPPASASANIELRFHADMQRIKQLQSIDARIALKATVVTPSACWFHLVTDAETAVKTDHRTIAESALYHPKR